MIHTDLIAGLLTEDPNLIINEDEVLFEWFWRSVASHFTDPLEIYLAKFLDQGAVKQRGQAMRQDWEGALKAEMGDLRQRFEEFRRYYRLELGKALEAFEYYNKHRRLPPDLAKNPADLNRIGGQDFRNPPSG